VPYPLLPKVRDLIFPYMDLDVHVEKKETYQYTVRSIYFDSPNLDYYHDKTEGLGSRDKVRIRVYNTKTENSEAFLEIKRKFMLPLSKFRAQVKYADLERLFVKREIQDFISGKFKDDNREQENIRRFFYYIYKNNLKPTVLVVFEREPYDCKLDQTVRITFDKYLRSKPYPALDEIYPESGLVETFPGYFVMEVKFNFTFPFWMRPIISRFNLRTEAISKYTTSIEKHDMLANGSKYFVMSQAHLY
jgi:VTC domain-containing protein